MTILNLPLPIAPLPIKPLYSLDDGELPLDLSRAAAIAIGTARHSLLRFGHHLETQRQRDYCRAAVDCLHSLVANHPPADWLELERLAWSAGHECYSGYLRSLRKANANANAEAEPLQPIDDDDDDQDADRSRFLRRTLPLALWPIVHGIWRNQPIPDIALGMSLSASTIRRDIVALKRILIDRLDRQSWYGLALVVGQAALADLFPAT
jgi:hypothetical protein